MAMEVPGEDNDDFRAFNQAFLYIYTAEMVIKIGKLGFIKHRRSYLR